MPSHDVVAQIFTQAKDSSGKAKDPSITEISKATVLSWNQCHLTRKGKQLAQANKTSAIKYKVLEIDIVMSSSLFMLITYYSVMTDTNECD